MVSGARSVKGASAGPRTLLTPLTRRLQLLAYPWSVAQPCPAPGHRAAYPHTRTGVWLCSVPSLVPFNTVPRAGLPASRPSESWAWPQWFGGPLCPLYPSVIPWHCSAVGSSHAQGGRGPVGAAVRLWFGEGSAEWMGPSQEPSQAAPPIPVYSVSTSVSHAEHVRGQTCVFI